MFGIPFLPPSGRKHSNGHLDGYTSQRIMDDEKGNPLQLIGIRSAEAHTPVRVVSQFEWIQRVPIVVLPNPLETSVTSSSCKPGGHT